MSVLDSPKCPTCGAELVLEPTGLLDAWTCPAGHGLGFTLSEAYVRIAEDEIHELWAKTAGAPASTRRCPLCNGAMVVVTVPTGQADVALDVCVNDEFLWFDAGELDVMPGAQPVAPPTADETAHVQQIADQFADAVDVSWEQRDAATFVNHIADVVSEHSSRTRT
jgi:Zn-finger nucleic acid-binding protein